MSLFCSEIPSWPSSVRITSSSAAWTVTLTVLEELSTIGRLVNVWGQIGDSRMTSSKGKTIGPPTDNEYAIYEGNVGSYYNHASKFCSTGGATTWTFTPATWDAYYLVVPHNGINEGSYGLDSASNERPQGVPACLPQLIGVCP